jgi:nucleoside-diphosphate-sugar epimerase
VRLAVTGATGFLGNHLVRAAVAAGHEVRVLLRPASSSTPWGARRTPPPKEVLSIEGLLPDWIPEGFLAQADVLVHLAAEGVQWEGRVRDQLHTVNVLGTLNLLHAAKSAGLSHVVLVGTALEYAGHGTLPASPSAERLLCRETDSLETTDRYGSSKAAAGLLARSEARRLKLPSWYLRLCSVYGPGDRPTKLLPSALNAARERQVFEMTAGQQLRDWLHVNDAVKALLRATELPPGAAGVALNVGTGDAVELHQLIETVFVAAGADPRLIRRGALEYRTDEVHQLVLDPELGQATLGWQPQIDLQTGLGQLVSSS